jgi:hypothetical protein
VIQAVDKMLALLQQEETADLQKKESCESARAADTREAAKTSRGMDDLSDSISADKAKILELAAEIADKSEQVAAIVKELKEIKRIRDDEEKEYLVNKKDDEDAAQLVVNAKDVISKFYTDNGLMLAQQQKEQRGKQPFISQAGEAPPPPPPTWEAPYGGRTDEQTGIVAILGMIREDILMDIQKATKEEGAAVALYTKSKSALETEEGELTQAIGALQMAKGDKEQDVIDNTGDRLTQKGSLAVVMDRIKAAEPGCDFFAINYPLRVKNRQIEVDGLLKAKTILSGGSFSAEEDPNRELKPGDAAALVQGRLRAGRKRLQLAAGSV